MKFLSVRNGGLKGERVRSQPIRPRNIGGNELTLAGVVKEDLACSGSSLPKKPKKNKTKLLGRKRVGPPGIIYRVGPPEKFFIYIPPSPATVQVYRIF